MRSTVINRSFQLNLERNGMEIVDTKEGVRHSDNEYIKDGNNFPFEEFQGKEIFSLYCEIDGKTTRYYWPIISRSFNKKEMIVIADKDNQKTIEELTEAQN